MKETFDEQIDSTLRALGSVTPPAGIEKRITSRITNVSTNRRESQFFNFRQFAFGISAAAIASAVIVIGSVSHSRHLLPVAPGLHLPANSQAGVGAASAAHVAPQPVTSLPQDRPRSVRKTVNGRALISPHAKRHAGVTVPNKLHSEE